MKLFAACSFLLLVLINAACVAESRAVANSTVKPQRRHDHGGHHDDKGDHDHGSKKPTHKLFVFGDEAADNGNGRKDPGLGAGSRVWRYPFGMSDTVHGRKPTGRASDGLVQSDFLAMIMGHRASPPAYESDDWDDTVDAAGMNFAVGGACALAAGPGVHRLRDQVQDLRDLVRDGVVKDKDLKGSVALVAYSGNDYGYTGDKDVGSAGFVAKVVDELENVVEDLQDLGVGKVLVNTLPPFGCSAWQARGLNYDACNDGGNALSDRHNSALRDRLGDLEDDGVMLLDVNTVFMDLVAPKAGSALAAQFTERLRPCCEAYDEDGYCGLDSRYSICDRPDEYFYWDFYSPTHAGWRAAMRLLQGPIMAFLGISNLKHF